MNDPIKLIASKTDAEEAAEIRAALSEPLETCCRIMTEARAKGLQISYSIAPDQFGRYVPTVTIVKPL